MKDDTYQFFREFVKNRSGLNLSSEKQYLVETRLSRVLRNHMIASLDVLANLMRQGSRHDIERDVIEAMTTNETLFFRDKTPFEALRNHIMPELLKARAATQRLRIWSAAASSGQEAYSIAMILDQMRSSLLGWTIEILGTDISTAMIAKAKGGVYSQFEVQRGLPVKLLLDYFRKEGDQWHLDDRIKRMVDFRPLNLLRDFTPLGRFDLILCRNVLIYFDVNTRTDVLERMHGRLASDGVLVLGAAETTFGITSQFTIDTTLANVYRPVRIGEAASAMRVAS
jgi:chemotaxis protein methyltransferase CheR